jgi:hypothetical protein
MIVLNMPLSFKHPIIGGIVSAIVLGLTAFFFGETSGFNARELLVTSLPRLLLLCFVIILGSISILGLMLGLLRINFSKESALRHRYCSFLLYTQKLNTILIITAIIILLLVNLPFTQTKIIPDSWYIYIYYSILVIASIMGGGFVTLISMIYKTISEVINYRDGEVSVDSPEVQIKEAIEKKIKKVEDRQNITQ